MSTPPPPVVVAPPTGPTGGFSVTVMDNGFVIASVVVGAAALGLGYYYFFRSQDPFTTRLTWFAITVAVVALLAYGIYFIYSGVTGGSSTGNLAPSVGVNPTTANSGNGLVVPGSSLPVAAGTSGANYGMQWWMYVQDWNYKFGQAKDVLILGSPGAANPHVYLDSVENTLCVQVNVMSTAAGAAPAPVGSDGSAVDDKFTCKVKNVPLQTWFSVSVSVNGRNVDIYQDGLLVRSCLLPGVPQTASGDLVLMGNGGYSGNLAGLYAYGRALTPSDAMAFYSAGPPSAALSATAASVAKTPSGGYNVKLSLVDTSGQEINKYTW
uniref:Lectin/glucanase superfamily protein n=1 Tax=viral metagenome TaxID=1070528 RepID=A0A6C0CJZ3_9ZZZZ